MSLDVRDEAVSVWGGRLDLHFRVAGGGPALVYLHQAPGLRWDPFLERLAGQYTVYAPLAPGTAPGDEDAIAKVDDVWDLVLVYEEGIRRLGLERPPAIGSSFGGMLACELAAHFPSIFSRLVLLDPIGLWRDDLPVRSGLMVPPEDQAELLFFEPDGDAARAVLAPPDDPDEAAVAIASLVWTLGCTSKFFWPIPDRGLWKRMHRIEAPALIVWGKQDNLVPVGYAQEFASRIARSRVALVDACGHIPQAEQLETTLALVVDFLAEPDGAR
jgi:pimeloyl-ACP methyl ester carboxylesterase